MNRYTWILDPGHGGLGPGGEYLTPGKRSPHVPPGIYEGELNRQVAALVVGKLYNVESPVTSTITNPGPVNAGLRARVEYIRGLQKARNNCVVISIHANAAGNAKRWYPANGAVVFHNRYDKKGKHLAQWMIESLDTWTTLNVDRGVKTANFRLLSCAAAGVPSVLVECGFMTNEADAELMASYMGRESIAKAISDVIQNFEIHGGL